MNSGSHPSRLKISDFTYELPEELIAKYPLKDRDTSRLLVFRNQILETSTFKDLPKFLDQNTLMVFNSSKVIPARLNFKNSREKNIEVFCLEPTLNQLPTDALRSFSPQRWNCLVGNLRAWEDQELVLEKNELLLKAVLVKKEQGYVEIEFNWNSDKKTLAEVLNTFGAMPIPPYLNRKSEHSDQAQYQTLYADQEGSVAAPTAGLHFTASVMTELEKKGVQTEYLKLHVGAGTFKPVKSEELGGHEMHAEWMDVDLDTILRLANSEPKSILAVGTTSLRCLESLYWMGVKLRLNDKLSLEELQIKQWEVYEIRDDHVSVDMAFNILADWMHKSGIQRLICRTSILIAPPYKMRVVKNLLTNFHQPQSTLLLLVAAAVGKEWRKIYKYAVQNNFRFLSYGDAMLLSC